MDFQRLGYASFETEKAFVGAFSKELIQYCKALPAIIAEQLKSFAADNVKNNTLQDLFIVLSEWCHVSDKKIVLMIDEIDSATNNQVFLDFLAQIRSYYLDRDELPTFHSVILAGVYDVRNIKRKMRAGDEHKANSPWNIAADFDIVMSFSKEGIAGMLRDYEADNPTTMNVDKIAGLIADYTSGYPYLVSRICKLIDEKVTGSNGFPDRTAAWTDQGFLEAVRILLSEKNPLFESLIGKLNDYPELQKIVYDILFGGKKIVYNPDSTAIDIATMFGLVKNNAGTLVLANRIFEIRLYNYFLTANEAQSSEIFEVASNNKSNFISNGRLDMDMVIRKFVEHFDSIYGGQTAELDEDEGRRRFLLYIRPIINGTGNYYIEPQTRDARRMDVVIDYLGEQFIIELKIWRGNSYNERGEKQQSETEY